jgi:crotonobetainyl-CoA:carnitine CoA-transferase CaiB-like acyl-CoA transferase
VAISVRDDRDWQALCDAIGRPDMKDRREARQDVEAGIGAWTREREAEEIEATLQAHGVPAHTALDTPGLFADAQLQQRGHFIEIAHEMFPSMTIESSRLRFSRTPARAPERALSLGRDNRYVLETLLGYSPERIADLAARGVLC